MAESALRNALPSSFNPFRKDAQGNAIQAGNAFLTEDSTGTPVTSPVTTGSSVTTLIVPANAIFFTAFALTNPVRVSDESTAAAHYFTLETANTAPVTFSCANMKNIYLLNDGASNGVCHFFFTTV